MADQAPRGHAWNDAFLTLSVRKASFQAFDGYYPWSSSISVTSAAIGERSERVSVTCANSG